MRTLRQLAVFLLLAPLKVYKLIISPLLPPMCRFHPSCSVYAMGAIAVHGPVRGVLLAARRLARCHPFNPGGVDPVPRKDGLAAEAVLEKSHPFIARRLTAAPPPFVVRNEP